MGGYRVNDYNRNNWHTRDKNCCEGCNNPINYDPRVQSAHAAAVQLTQFFTGLVSTSIDYAATKQASKTEKTVDVPESTTPDRGRSADVEEAEVVQEDVKVETSVEKENNVKNIIGADKFNGLSAEIKADVLKKYDTIKAYAQQNNIKVTDAEMKTRLSNYVKALEQKATFKKMNAELEKNVTGNTAEEIENSQVKIAKTSSISHVDEDVKVAFEKKDTDAYFNAFENQGIGLVQLYDANGDQKVTHDEFLEAQKKSIIENLPEEFLANATEAKIRDFVNDNLDSIENTFNAIDKTADGYLDSTELATHQYVMAGFERNGVSYETTFAEWLATQAGITGESEALQEKYKKESDEVFQGFKSRK